MVNSNKIAKILLKAGTDPNIQDNLGKTCLIDKCFCFKYKIAKILLDFEADPNIRDKLGNTNLITSITTTYSLEIVQLLIKMARIQIFKINMG